MYYDKNEIKFCTIFTIFGLFRDLNIWMLLIFSGIVESKFLLKVNLRQFFLFTNFLTDF